MRILFLLIFISLVLVLLAVILFVFSVGNEDFDHALQQSLKPLDEDAPLARQAAAAPEGAFGGGPDD
jgi:nitrogen fixation-related uncharacterized protein